jgi:GNAT superfamily N-acetyltransferase
MQIRLLEELDEATEQQILLPLRDYNRANNSVFYEAREQPEHAERAMNVVACDSDGRIVGGLIGQTQFYWLKIKYMSVADDHRRRGIGRQIMSAAEAEAIARGCRYSFVDTMDYQAPVFYQKLGYEIAGKLPNWDSHGHAKLFLMKGLK